ncbi:transposase [Pararhizobium polonicum]|uniref:Transposase n=1 Tax=Pararhizobium polonicum TaxID=1612624 RepID=A0A1C7P2V3_9HYPH|nr:transposase [Pararhizobium polonicum]
MIEQKAHPTTRQKTLKTAYATIKGFKVMCALHKGQAAIFNLTGDIRGEARIVERAFGIVPSALTEAVGLLAQSLENRGAVR